MPRTTKVIIKPRKEPSQSRSQRTVEIILQAATRVLAKESLAGFNTNRVAEVAGISVGSLYQYFPNKDALVTALIKAEHESLTEQFESLADQLKGADAVTTLKAIAHLTVKQQFAKPLLAAALDHEEARLPLHAELEPAHNALMHSIAKLAKPHYPHLDAVALKDCMTIAQALVESEAASSKDAPSDLEGRVFKALFGYLGKPSTD